MPKTVFGKDYRFLDRKELLTFEEITRARAAAVDVGVAKLRLTGGEPLLRVDLERLIAMLSELPVDLTLTTNASLLPKKAQALKDAGLKRITVSLDSLDDAIFRAMNDVDFPVARVLEGIEAAQAVGHAGQGELRRQARRQRATRSSQLARHFRGTGVHAPLHRVHGRRRDERLAHGRRRPRGRDRRDARQASSASSRPTPLYRGEVAKRWRYKDGSRRDRRDRSVTQPFCGDCTRSRLSAEGKLYTCLFAVRGHDLRALIRSGATDEELADKLARDLARPRRPLLGAPRPEHRRPCDRRAQGRDELHRRLARRPAVPATPSRPLGSAGRGSYGLAWTACSGRRRPAGSVRRSSRLVQVDRVGVGGCSRAALFAAGLGGPGPPDRDLARLPARVPGGARARRPAAREGVLERPQGRRLRDELQRTGSTS